MLVPEFQQSVRVNRRIYLDVLPRKGMTSIIHTMNSNGVAFATDSAVSYGDHYRNSAQKLFSLPGRQPIAFMIMGSGKFGPANLSWVRIFYKYNLYYIEKYGAESELPTVEDYEKDFIDFLESLVSVEDNESALAYDIWVNWVGRDLPGEKGILLNSGYLDDTPDSSPEGRTQERRGLDAMERLLDNYESNASWISAESYDDIEHQYKVKQIEKWHGDTLNKATEWILMSALLGDEVSDGNWEKFRENLSSELQEEVDSYVERLNVMLKRWLAAWGNFHSWKKNGSQADVVFGGFGKNDEFPRTTHIVTGSRVNGLGNSAELVFDRNIVDPNVRWPEQEEGTHNWRCNAFLEALAQNEFILRMTTGLSKTFAKGNVSKAAVNSIEGWLNYQGTQTIAEVEGVSEELAESVVSHLVKEKISGAIGDHFGQWVHNQQVEVKQEFRQAVSRLSPVELAELASDLIEVQAKTHNIVNSQASVDLPVDVCYLSKENGFIWYSRKNLPNLELNPRISSMDWEGSQLD